jgi:hypothetical protein
MIQVKYRIQVEYRVVGGDRIRTVKYDCASSLELFDRFVRMRGQKLEYLYIAYLRKRWNRRYRERSLMGGWTHNPIRLECWSSYEYREMIAQKVWDMITANPY